MYYKIEVVDAIITDPSDPLYSLQGIYKVKISRSNQSDAVYIFKSRSRAILRVGHPISRNSNHLWNFTYSVFVNGQVTKTDVEQAIKKYINKL